MIKNDANIYIYLIEHGAYHNERNSSGSTPLHSASENRTNKNGANANEKDNNDWTHLCFAAEKGYDNIVQ